MWDLPLFPEQASTNAGRVDLAYFFALAVTVFFTTLVLFLIVGFTVWYRRGRVADRTNPPESSFVLEVLWIGVPAVLAIAMFVLGAQIFFDLFEPPADASTIYVIGKQWMWKLQHPEGKKEINELHVPLGRPVKLLMTSEDVIHSFFVPAFRTKQDVLPGRYVQMWFRPTRVGKYHLFCAEYCGTNHSRMVGSVYVMDPADYERWLTGGNVPAAMAKEGEDLFVQHHCAGCHGASQTVRAPRLEESMAARCRSRRGKTSASSWPTTATFATPSCCLRTKSWPDTSRSCPRSRT
jgi:cytochrome c oxidase subunit 2